MTRTAYDSTTAGDTPKGGALYLGYVDGLYANVAELRGRHKGARVVGITVNGSTLDAQMADVESGDLTPAGGALWARRKRDLGEIGTLYFPASSRAAVVAACRANRLTPGKDVLFFAAQYDGKAKIPRWAVGKQYLHGDAGHPGSYSGGHYDTSVVRDYWPGVDPKPTPAPKPHRRLIHLLRSVLRRLTHHN